MFAQTDYMEGGKYKIMTGLLRHSSIFLDWQLGFVVQILDYCLTCGHVIWIVLRAK
jgi:hypothetical protein